MKNLIILLIGITYLTACDNSSSKEQSNNKEVTKTAQKYKLTPFSPSKAYPDAKIKGYTYKDGSFSFDVSGTDYALGQQTPDAESKMCANSSKGQHIHLIVDNAPYAAKYTAEFDYDMPSGERYLLTFLSRSYHESIKTDAAHIGQKVNIVDNAIAERSDIEESMLFYSRPKGTYIGDDTEKVMLDFYPINVDMTQHQVRATINGEDHVLDQWQPYYIEGLPMGNNTITLTLEDRTGKVVDTPLNPVTRKFTLIENLEPSK